MSDPAAVQRGGIRSGLSSGPPTTVEIDNGQAAVQCRVTNLGHEADVSTAACPHAGSTARAGPEVGGGWVARSDARQRRRLSGPAWKTTEVNK